MDCSPNYSYEWLNLCESFLFTQCDTSQSCSKTPKGRKTQNDLWILLRPLVNEDPEDLTDVLADFTRCANNVERLVRIARAAPHKLLNTTRVAQYLLDHGQSKGSFKNLRTEIDRAFTKHTQLFEKVTPGTYRYKGDTEVEVEETTDAPMDASTVSVGVDVPVVDESC